MNRKATEAALFDQQEYAVLWAIPDHPWVDSSTGAAVRIAMTVGGKAQGGARLVQVLDEAGTEGDEVAVTLSERSVPAIHSNLRSGAAVTATCALTANSGICSVALVRFGEGFVVDAERSTQLEAAVVHPLLTGRDLNQSPTKKFVIDFYPMDERESRETAPRAFQHVLEHVKPTRDQIRDPGSRQRWWRFGRDKPELRQAIAQVQRYAATSEVSKNRVFSFVNANVRPDHTLVVIACDDAFLLGVLSSRPHIQWAKVAGSRMGMGNDLRYNRSVCFDPFPFPVTTDSQKRSIRDIAESLDAHRKRQQAAHPDLTITGMYNVLEKLRSGEVLTAKDKVIHEQGLVSVLKKLHDDLDAAVFDAYGWPHDLTDEQILERLVALNAERAAEERRGLIRWLRPEFQNPSGAKAATQEDLATTDEPETAAPVAATATAWPKKLAEQIAAVRDLLTKGAAEWTKAEVAAAFKGANKADVEEVLDSLAALGILAAYESRGTRRWKSTRAAA